MGVSCSVILEWDNPCLDNADASTRALSALARELAADLDGVTIAELLIPFKAASFDASTLEAAARSGALGRTLAERHIDLRAIRGSAS